ncbi:MAG TPA: hypothetical protein VGB79_10090 [Allosphingosinicella sp.]|jgi:hypothetical protein
MRSIIQLAAAFAAVTSAAPAEAVPSSRVKAEAPSQSEPETIRAAAEFEAYSAWLLALDRSQASANEAVQSLQGAWQAAIATADSRRAAATFRPAVARAIEALDAAHADLAAVETPDFPLLDLPEDLRTAPLLAVFRQSNRDLRTGIEGFYPMVDALQRRDQSGFDAAVDRLMGAFRIVMLSQATMLRASLAATPRDESSWEVVNIQLLAANASVRLMTAWPAIQSRRPDPSFAPDMLAIAEQLDGHAAEGARKLETELIAISADLADAEAARDSASTFLLRRGVAALVATRQIFPPARTLAATLRERAPQLRGAIDLQAVAALSSAIRAARLEFERVATEEVEAVAGN